jgi:hypothetical protein
VDTPDSARMAKLPAVAKLTAAGPVARTLLAIAWRAKVSMSIMSGQANICTYQQTKSELDDVDVGQHVFVSLEVS